MAGRRRSRPAADIRLGLRFRRQESFRPRNRLRAVIPWNNRRESYQPLALEVHLEDPRERLLEELADRQKELQHRPQDGMLQLQIGRLLSRLERDTKARAALEAAMESGALFEGAIDLSACEVRLEHWTAALAVLERALSAPALSPAQQGLLSNALAWYLSLAPPGFRNPARAIDCVHRALEVEPDNLAYINTLGLALYRQGEPALASQALKISLRGSPAAFFDLCCLALCYQSSGESDIAADFASRADYLFETHREEWPRQERIEFQWLRAEYPQGVRPP